MDIIVDERDARRLPTGKNYAPERTRLESVAGFNTAECNAEPPPGVRALLITLNPAPGKFNALPSSPNPSPRPHLLLSSPLAALLPNLSTSSPTLHTLSPLPRTFAFALPPTSSASPPPHCFTHSTALLHTTYAQ